MAAYAAPPPEGVTFRASFSRYAGQLNTGTVGVALLGNNAQLGTEDTIFDPGTRTPNRFIAMATSSARLTKLVLKW